MKKSSYMTRAMKARDPRYARILAGLGYQRTDMVDDDDAPAKKPVADQDATVDGALKQKANLSALRKRYQEVVGKKPFGGWDADTLQAKISEGTKA
jgi:hypothetical protein